MSLEWNLLLLPLHFKLKEGLERVGVEKNPPHFICW